MIDILKNSFVMAIIVFVASYFFFYLFGIGYETQIINGRMVRRMSWKYPLALSLLVWMIWYFYLYPAPEVIQEQEDQNTRLTPAAPFDTPKGKSESDLIVAEPANKVKSYSNQKMIMQNWV